jgi:hypothetical protein
MARKTKAQLAAEAAAEAEAEQSPEELEALLAAGYEAGDDEDMDEEFDLSALRDAEEAGDFDAFAADVVIQCTKVEKAEGQSSGDAYLKLTWVVQEGPHVKAHIWDIVMLQGKGVGFAKKKVNQLGLSLDRLTRSNLIGLTVAAKTKVEKGKDNYDDKTVIKKYLGQVGVSTSEDLPE